jgi:hypothetical protein
LRREKKGASVIRLYPRCSRDSERVIIGGVAHYFVRLCEVGEITPSLFYGNARREILSTIRHASPALAHHPHVTLRGEKCKYS